MPQRAARTRHSRRGPLLTLATASALVALTGCAPGQQFGPPCPLVDFDVFITVKLDTAEEVEAVGICDEIACTTDESIPENSAVAKVWENEYFADEPNTWSFSVIQWMPDEVGVVAIVDGEEIDLGTHTPTKTSKPIEGEHCGSIPGYESITIEL